MPWIDDFVSPSNRLSSKWVATRYSQGGQNDGQWNRVVANSKLTWIGVNAGTEAGYWGEKLSLPVNAVGYLTIEANIRLKRKTGNGDYILGVGFNQTPNLVIRYGTLLLYSLGIIYKRGYNNFGNATFPGFPSKIQQGITSTDMIENIRVVRKNGYVFLYLAGLLAGSYAYAPAITSVDIISIWINGLFDSEHSLDYIKVWPASVVL